MVGLWRRFCRLPVLDARLPLFGCTQRGRYARRGERGGRVSGFEMGLLLFVVTLAVIALRMPVGLAMFFVGGVGYVLLVGWAPLINTLSIRPIAGFRATRFLSCRCFF